MDNPFTILENRLNKLESLSEEIKTLLSERLNPNKYTSDIMKMAETCDMTGYKRGYIYELVRRRAIPYFKVGNALRFSRAEIDMWIKAGRLDITQEAVDQMAANYIVNGIKGQKSA